MKRGLPVGRVSDPESAAVYLATRSSFTADEILADAATMQTAFAEVTRTHPSNPWCEHCVRAERARDVLLGVAPSAPGESRLPL